MQKILDDAHEWKRELGTTIRSSEHDEIISISVHI